MITPDSLRAWNAGLIAVAAPTPPEIDALKEELNSWRNTAAERTMQKASLLDELVTLKAENEKLRKVASEAIAAIGSAIDGCDVCFDTVIENLAAAMTPDTKGE